MNVPSQEDKIVFLMSDFLRTRSPQLCLCTWEALNDYMALEDHDHLFAYLIGVKLAKNLVLPLGHEILKDTLPKILERKRWLGVPFLKS